MLKHLKSIKKKQEILQRGKYTIVFNNRTSKRKFILSRAPWWGGQFEKMAGLVKQCLYKATEKAKQNSSSHKTHEARARRSHTEHRDDDDDNDELFLWYG